MPEEFSARDSADRIISSAEKLLQSPTKIERAEERMNFLDLWNGLNCDQKTAVGKLLEKADGHVAFEFYKSNDGSNKLDGLKMTTNGFGTYWKNVTGVDEYITDPFKGCRLGGADR